MVYYAPGPTILFLVCRLNTALPWLERPHTIKPTRFSCFVNLFSLFHTNVLIEEAHYYTIFVEAVHTIREDVLIEESTLTEGVRYVIKPLEPLMMPRVNHVIGHWKKLYLKVSQGGARGARMNYFL